MLRQIILLCALLSLTVNSVFAQDTTATNYKVGVMLPLTGFAEVFGGKVKRGIDRANHAEVKLLFEDDICDAVQALSAYRKLTDVDHIKFFLGPCCPAVTSVLAPLIKQNKQVSLSLCTGIGSNYERSGHRVFLPQYSGEDEGRFNAEAMYYVAQQN